MSHYPNGPDRDDLEIAYAAMGDLLASVPYRLGYQPIDELAIQFSGPNSRTLGSLEWNTNASTLDTARQAADMVAKLSTSGSVNAILLQGFGPAAAERVYALREALQNQLDGADITIAAVQVDNNKWRAFGIGVTGEWHQMPEVPVKVLLDGYPAPAASLGEHLKQFSALPEPTYQPLPDNSRELIDASPPGIRAELATRALQRLADRDPRPLDQATLAHVVDDPAVNHAVIANAYTDRARLGALVDTYRGAPPHNQAALANAAATALWLRGSIHEAQHLSAQIPDHHYYATARDHLNTLITAGRNPHTIAPQFAEAADTHLRQAEAAWVTDQPQPAQQDSAPTTDLRPPPAPGVDGPGL